MGKGKLIHAGCPVAAPPHYLPLVVPLRPGPVLCVLLVPTPPLLAILLSNALTFSRTCPTRRLSVLPWPSILPLPPCLRFLSPFAASPLPLRLLLSLLPLPEVVSPLLPPRTCPSCRLLVLPLPSSLSFRLCSQFLSPSPAPPLPLPLPLPLLHNGHSATQPPATTHVNKSRSPE